MKLPERRFDEENCEAEADSEDGKFDDEEPLDQSVLAILVKNYICEKVCLFSEFKFEHVEVASAE